MFLAKPLRFRADLVCARSLRERRRSSERRFFVPCWPCASSRPSSPAREPDVRIEPPCELAPRIRCARRAASRIPVSGRALRAALADPGERTRLARRAASRSRLASCPPQRSTAARFRRGALHGGRRHGNVRPRCALGSSATAGCSRNAFPGAWLWQVFAVVRSRAAIRGNFLASCISEGAPDGKSAPPWQHIAAMHPKRAGFGKICAPCIRKAPQTAFRECIARRSCQGEALFAALAPRIMHGVRILPGPPLHGPPRILPGSPHCTDPSNHARCANLARGPSNHASYADLAILWRSLPFGGEVSSPEGWEFRFLCFGGARSSVLVRRTIPPCRLGYRILELLGLRHPCLAGKSPVPSLSSAGYPAAVFSAG